jgi:beta-phosphoglucomutase-like phosphatase (HAD superfamily)
VPALIFDCDGVLADTERDGHRPAFNRTFAEVGVPVEWSVDEYAEKLRIGGGKERMASLLTPEFVRANRLPTDEDGRRQLLADWHRRKTAIYKEMVRAGKLPARSGIARIVDEALAAGAWPSRRPRPRTPCGPSSSMPSETRTRGASTSSPATSCRPRSLIRRSTNWH